MKKLVVIDTLNLLFRSYYAMRNLRSSTSDNPIGMIFGLLNFMLKLKEEIECDYVIFALDSSNGSFRKDFLQDYKANRKELEDDLKFQIPICIELIKKAGFAIFEKDKYEADDIIASVAKIAKENEIFTSVYSTDKDLYQLIDDRYLELVGKNYEIINEASCDEKFGVKPNQMVDYLALVGDSADNFKGVAGIGPVAAKRLLNEYTSIENIYKNLNVIGNKSAKNKLLENKDDAILSQRLAKLVDDIKLGDIFECSKKPNNNFFANLIEDLEKFELYKFLKIAKNVDEIIENTEKVINLEFKSVLLNDEEELLKIVKNLNSNIGFDTETTGLSYNDKIVGFSFCKDNISYYVPILHKNTKNIDEKIAKEALIEIFKNPIIGHNLKFDFKMLKNNYGIDYPKVYMDSMISAWLLNPSDKFSLDYLALKFLNYKCINYEEIVAKNEKFCDIDINIAYKYATQDAFITKAIFDYVMNNLDYDLKECLKIEMNFIKTLVEMENNGILLDNSKLLNLKAVLEQELKELEQNIFDLAGITFNLNSPKQLKEILYEKLSLPDHNKGSTNEATLLKLTHPIASKILEYRTAMKVLSTYVLPLLELNENNQDTFIVRSNFLQTGTSTGRLSSNNPNLQNIPAKSKYSKPLKEAFIASKGCSFISLDYSQIELRMLAHFSNDKNLLEAFLNDEDIHARTAKEIFKEVDSLKRSYAKSINFGLIYGMGAARLSDELKITYSEASDYIKKYFESFPTIKTYFENTKKHTKDVGFITTLLKRKRYFTYSNDIRTNNANDRECINSILQGSAADLIKLAMIKIMPCLNEKTKLILQIHDELVFQVEDNYVDEFAKIAKNIMENAYPLKVKLKTSFSIGKNLAELK